VTSCSRRLLRFLFATTLAAALPGFFGVSAGAQTLGGGLDCNGWSPISKNVKGAMVCADPHGLNGTRFYDNGWYIGHDEPTAQFYSNRPGSGNHMFWRFNLPKRDPVPNQSGTSVATFELTPAIWFSLSLCDQNSFPQNPCIPDSDRNTGIGLTTDAGSAVLEVQFYPPGWPPFINQISCDNTHWCAALTIDSLECDFNFNCNASCTEPVNFAFVQQNGVPPGPPAPGQQTAATFTPNAQTLLMNPGDDIVVLLQDTQQGLLLVVFDLSNGQTGFMVAGARNGFANTNLTSCATTPFNFHPEYNTASTQNVNPRSALQANVNYAIETGHFELGANGDGDSDDSECFLGPTIAGCLDISSGGDLDFNGPPYRPDWPDGSRKHPKPIQVSALTGNGIGPMSVTRDFDDPRGYSSWQLKADVSLSNASCDLTTGAGCVIPPDGAAFYPFFNLVAGEDYCRLAFGNDIPGETFNDFGKDAQYGPFITTPGVVFGNAGPVMPNPCKP
jgi:hypothetical protein